MRLVILALALLAVSCGGTPAPSPTSVPEGATTTRAPVPGAANLALACRAATPRCDNPGFDMSVLGDRVESCEALSGGTSIRLQLKSSDDPNDGVIVAFDGYHGAGTYSLDEPNTRFFSVDDHVSVAQCEGGPIDVGKRVTAADPNCGSPACTVEVSDATPDAPFPKPLTFTVHCTSVCQNGSDVTCAGPIDFVTHADCT